MDAIKFGLIILGAPFLLEYSVYYLLSLVSDIPESRLKHQRDSGIEDGIRQGSLTLVQLGLLQSAGLLKFN